ncbi:MAG: polysaccharide biosynthesis/export family protein [Opitutaceae bacterium]|nr:polysaccharide biosynthesis/export family protein [Cytophagales bacterium]
MLLTDKKAKSYKKRQLEDTTVNLLPYEYKIRNGDVISIDITNITPGEYQLDKVAVAGEVNSGYLVNDSGYVDVPVIGMVKVAGLNTEQCRNTLKAKATEYLHNVVVNVKLLSFEVNVIGEIGSQLTINSPDGKLSIIDAIALARGPNTYTNFEKIKIIRQNENADKMHVFYVDVTDLNVVNNREHFYLMPKDILVFEPHKSKTLTNIQRNLGLATSIISAVFLVYSTLIILKIK